MLTEAFNNIGAVNSVAFSHDYKQLITASSDLSLKIIDLGDNSLGARLSEVSSWYKPASWIHLIFYYRADYCCIRNF